MLYNSFPFIFGFLPVCLLLYFAAARIGRGLGNVVLVVISLAFYAWWNWHNVPILLASILFNFGLGLRLRRGSKYRLLLMAGVAGNLALLGFFKYANFAMWNAAELSGRTFSPWSIVLPLGISFFTFTQIAFLVDAWRGEARELDFARYCLFVTFFPHLIAGPIVHHRELMPQFASEAARRWNSRNVSLGIAFFALGLFKKLAIADTLGPLGQ
jgi:alginate O-acetyltransferase complex protein AlgI